MKGDGDDKTAKGGGSDTNGTTNTGKGSDIVATNGISVRKGHTLLNNLVAAGEVPLALTIYISAAEQTKRKGAPLDWFALPPAVARPNGVAVARNAPHPHAAILFFDFLINPAQPILASRQFVPASRKIETPLNHSPLKLIDVAALQPGHIFPHNCDHAPIVAERIPILGEGRVLRVCPFALTLHTCDRPWR